MLHLHVREVPGADESETGWDGGSRGHGEGRGWQLPSRYRASVWDDGWRWWWYSSVSGLDAGELRLGPWKSCLTASCPRVEAAWAVMLGEEGPESPVGCQPCSCHPAASSSVLCVPCEHSLGGRVAPSRPLPFCKCEKVNTGVSGVSGACGRGFHLILGLGREVGVEPEFLQSMMVGQPGEVGMEAAGGPWGAVTGMTSPPHC